MPLDRQKSQPQTRSSRHQALRTWHMRHARSTRKPTARRIVKKVYTRQLYSETATSSPRTPSKPAYQKSVRTQPTIFEHTRTWKQLPELIVCFDPSLHRSFLASSLKMYRNRLGTSTEGEKSGGMYRGYLVSDWCRDEKHLVRCVYLR